MNLKSKVIGLEKEIVNRDERIKELEGRLGKNSTNSHTPPSRDTIQIKAAKQRVKGGKVGGQVGREGTTLKKSEFVHFTEIHSPKKCVCGKSLIKVAGCIVDTRQEFDIPVDHIITEHQRHQKVCPCCSTINLGRYPNHINAETQYGPNLKAFCLLSNTEYKQPYGKLAEMINTMYKLPISTGTIYNIIQSGYENLEQVENEILDELSKTKVMHADETGIVVNLKLYWMHVLSDSKYTHLRIHEKRGAESFNSLLNNYLGKLIHDFLPAYYKLNCNHGSCGSHIIREVDVQKELNKAWSDEFLKLLYELYKNTIEINISNKEKIYQRFEEIIALGINEEPIPVKSGNRGRQKRSKGLNLLNRLSKYKDDVLGFAFDPDTPFTNNQAERDLRHGKTKLKVSGCFRSKAGAEYYARIMSVISTLKKQSYDVFKSFELMFRHGGLTLRAE